MDSFVKPFAYMYEETDKVIERGTIIPEVNQLGKTPDIEEQIPVEVQPSISKPDPVVELPHEIPPQPSTTEPTIPSEPTTVSPPIEPKPSTIISHSGKNVQVGVSDGIVATDK